MAKRAGKRGARKDSEEEEKLTLVSRAATVAMVAMYFTGTSGLASHAGEHNSSGVTRCLSSPLLAQHVPTHFARTVETGGSLPALIYGITRLYIQIRSPFYGGGGGTTYMENGFCQGVTELFIYEVKYTG